MTRQDNTPAGDGAEPVADAVGTPRFAAFISYAHADGKEAARLHRQVEAYRLPRKLRRTDGGEAATRLGPLFRDRADLAAADSLSEAIRSALARSDALIVMCSPAATQSRWVNEEIRLFRAVNPGAPVLAAVVRGAPAEALPAALTEGGREPLAADLRREGDGWKLGFLKIVAALAGVPLDGLIQRDAQRKLRRVTGITVGALLALVAAVSMMTYAIQQRNEARAQREEAERRRVQAEGLVEFMLTDLRERLRGVGRIDIMRSAAGSALDSYGPHGAGEALGPDGQGQIARLLHAVGEDDFNAGQPGEAMASFRRAHAITAPLLADAPRDADRLFNHAQSEYWLGHAAYGGGDYRRAETHWRRYRDLALRLRDVEPQRRRSLQEVAYGEGNICTVMLAMQRPAVAPCRASYATQAALSDRYPDDPALLQTLGNRAAWYADALRSSGDLATSARMRREHVAIARRLIALDPDNYVYRDSLVGALYSLATSPGRDSDERRTRALLSEARTMIGAMRRHDPANQRWAALEAMIASRLAATGPQP